MVGAAPFLINPMMITHGEQISGVLVKGVDPTLLGQVLDLPTYLREGSLAGLRPVGSVAPSAPREEPSARNDRSLEDYFVRARRELSSPRGILAPRIALDDQPSSPVAPAPPAAPAAAPADLLPSGATANYEPPPDAATGDDPLDAYARGVAQESIRHGAMAAPRCPG